MLSDQAENLRRLVSHSQPSHRSSRSRLSVISGSKGGVGTTTISLNVAAALRRLGHRTLLVDCSPFQGDLAQMYHLSNAYDLDDVVEARCSIRQAIHPGPAGVQVLPRLGTKNAMSPSTHWQILRCFDQIIQDFDHILVDTGNCTAAMETLWAAADEAIIVTTTQQTAVTNAYALMKSMVGREVSAAHVGFLVNRYHNEQSAHDVMDRLVRSCRQFLSLEPERWGCIPADDRWESAVHEARSITCASPQSASAAAICTMAQQLALHGIPDFNSNPVAAN